MNTPEKWKIAFDLDGTLVDNSTVIRNYVSTALKCEPELWPCETYHGLEKSWPLGHRSKASKLLFDAFQKGEGGVYTDAPPFPYAAQVVNRMNDEGLFGGYITRRPGDERVIKQTVQWLDKHDFPRPERIKFHDGTPDKSAGMCVFHCETIVEDNPLEAARLTSLGYRVILFDQVYNRDLPFHLERFNNWLEFPNLYHRVYEEVTIEEYL